MEFNSSLIDGLIISCTWTPNADLGSKELKKTVKFSSKPNLNFDDIVQVESCVHLHCNKENIVPCKITAIIDKQSPYVIKRIDIISEARVIEFYGSCEEYINTVHGDLMDDFEGSTVYSASSFLPSLREIKINFARTKYTNKMWLYGLVLTVEEMAVPNLKIGGIDLSNVNDILKDSSRPISDKAELCKKLLHQCSNSMVSNNGTVDPLVLMKMFEGEYSQSFGESSKSMSKCLMKLIPFMMNNKRDIIQDHGDAFVSNNNENEKLERCKSLEDSVSFIPVNGLSASINDNNNTNILNSYDESCVKNIKDYIDKRINDLEQKLTYKFEQRLKDIETAQNKKLDTIIKLLEKK